MIKLTRESNQHSDKLRKYHVFLDGVKVGFISKGETIEIQTQPGYHTIYLKIDWCRSNKINFEIKEGKTLDFKCGGLSGFKILFVLWFITFGWNRYLWLKFVEKPI